MTYYIVQFTTCDGSQYDISGWYPTEEAAREEVEIAAHERSGQPAEEVDVYSLSIFHEDIDV